MKKLILILPFIALAATAQFLWQPEFLSALDVATVTSPAGLPAPVAYWNGDSPYDVVGGSTIPDPSAGSYWGYGTAGDWNDKPFACISSYTDYFISDDTALFMGNMDSFTHNVWYWQNAGSYITGFMDGYNDGMDLLSYHILKDPYVCEFSTHHGDPATFQIDWFISSIPNPPADESWHMVTMVSDATTLAIYFDAVLHYTGTKSAPATAATGTRFSMNARHPWSSFTGKMSMLGVWDVPLTEEQITTLYNSGNGRVHNEL